ncbi:hypothetical protein BES34_010430 [Leptospira inadai serovar Lyme]|uniref:Lipoprotein n=1 Tax=Leptospira inadai serovar Lyme TaxID=293084 RepID=A0ABX4YI90_9LEPT|nr:hypothetical protein BES34_010430 [Leptospira inadai serovar Lyme]
MFFSRTVFRRIFAGKNPLFQIRSNCFRFLPEAPAHQFVLLLRNVFRVQSRPNISNILLLTSSNIVFTGIQSVKLRVFAPVISRPELRRPIPFF